MEEKLKNIFQAILEGDMVAAQTESRVAVESGISGREILNTAMIPAMSEVGCLFEKAEYFVPEMLTAACAMKAGLEIVKPLLVNSDLNRGQNRYPDGKGRSA